VRSEPYLIADPARNVRENGVGASDVREIGIAWRGNPKNRRERWRSAPLEAWAPLANVPGVRYHALALGVSDEERSRAPFPLHTYAFADMEETAGFVRSLDTVVTVDTSIVHLAGALGVPTVLANPVNSDFRWGIERTDCPWYASVEIVRQSDPGRWDDVFARIAERLR
jgi:hypothetical protein